ERGVRPSRALPYELSAVANVLMGDGSVRLTFVNTGAATAVFHVRSSNAAHNPRNYTVEPGKQLSGVWAVAGVGATDYDLAVYGPNGFLREFKGSIAPSSTRLVVDTRYDSQTNHITLTLTNQGANNLTVDILDKYTARSVSERVDAGASTSKRW